MSFFTESFCLLNKQYPFFTVLFQSLAGVVVGVEALHTFVPFYVIDSVGCSFALATMKLLNPVLIAAPVVEVSKPKVSRKRKAESSSTAASSSSIPPDYECPISMELMTDPVICSDGFSYERSAIEIWLKAHDRSPKTNETLPNKTLILWHDMAINI